MNKKYTFIITGVGAPGILGTRYCIRNSPIGSATSLIGIDTNPHAIGKYYMDTFYVVPSVIHVELYNKKLLEICQKHKVDLIIPQTTNEIEHYAKYKSEFERNNIKVLVCSYNAIHIANNKISLLNIFTKLGLQTPQYKTIETYADFSKTIIAMGYPEKSIVIKLPVSNGSRGIRILTEKSISIDSFIYDKPNNMHMTFQEANQLFEKSPEKFPGLVAMEYLPGEEWSVDVFYDGKSNYIAIPRVRNIIRSGIAFRTTIARNNKICDDVKQASSSIGLSGVFGFQFKCNHLGVPLLLESNPRIQGTMVASCFAGANLIWMAIADKLELKYTVPNENEIVYGTVFNRLWGGVGLTSSGEFIDAI